MTAAVAEHESPTARADAFIVAVHRGDVLPWLLRYAPDGDADGAVRRTWDAAPPNLLLEIAWWLHGPRAVQLAMESTRVAGTIFSIENEAALVRRVIARPTFDQITKRLQLARRPT